MPRVVEQVVKALGSPLSAA